MSKLQLPSVTLIACDCINADLMIKVIEHCKSMVDFGDVKFLTSIPVEYEHRIKIKPLNSLIHYSIFMLKEIYKYVDTTHLLTIQRDGWILNPSSWDDSFLQNDYTAPLLMQMDRVGSGGFSLRSKKIMEDISKTIPDWDGTQKGAEEIQATIPFYEDGMLSLTEFSKNYKIASNEEGAKFANGGNRNPNYFVDYPFGFHRTFATINMQTGFVDNSNVTADIQASYDAEINAL